MSAAHITLDVTRLVRRLLKQKTLTGIDRVSIAYVRQYGDNAQALIRICGRHWVLSSTQSKQLFIWCLTPGSQLLLKWILIKGIVSHWFSKNQPYTFLLDTGSMRLKQVDSIRVTGFECIKPIFFVHDLIPINYPEYCSPGELQRHRQKINLILHAACGIITNSDATRYDLASFAYQTKQVLPPMKTALLAPGMVPLSPGKRPIDKSYFVVLGTIEPRKNHLLLLQLWRDLIQTFGDDTPLLVIIGKRGWECENIVDMLDRCQVLQGFVKEIASCDDQQLVTYLHHSQALLFPSFAEGYGLPLAEALALNVPVLANDLAVFREVAGDIPDYIAALDGLRWKELIVEYAKPNSVLRMAQIKRMQPFKSSTWDEHFIAVDAFLEKLKVS